MKKIKVNINTTMNYKSSTILRNIIKILYYYEHYKKKILEKN